MSVEVQVKNKDGELVTTRRWSLDVYKQWVDTYSRGKRSTRQKNQVKRWREVVERSE